MSARPWLKDAPHTLLFSSCRCKQGILLGQNHTLSCKPKPLNAIAPLPPTLVQGRPIDVRVTKRDAVQSSGFTRIAARCSTFASDNTPAPQKQTQRSRSRNARHRRQPQRPPALGSGRAENEATQAWYSVCDKRNTIGRCYFVVAFWLLLSFRQKP